jgi:hypothetical protein
MSDSLHWNNSGETESRPLTRRITRARGGLHCRAEITLSEMGVRSELR